MNDAARDIEQTHYYVDIEGNVFDEPAEIQQIVTLFEAMNSRLITQGVKRLERMAVLRHLESEIGYRFAFDRFERAEA